MIKRIVITGPESTGKSWLASALGDAMSWPTCTEYAREFLEERGGSYKEEDLRSIAHGQLRLDNEARAKAQSNGSGGYIADTDLMTIEIWSDFVFKHCDSEISRMSSRESADCYLLCDIDLPWEPDPLREHPNHRNELFSLYVSELNKRKRPFHIVWGHRKERLQNAINALISCGFPKSFFRG